MEDEIKKLEKNLEKVLFRLPKIYREVISEIYDRGIIKSALDLYKRKIGLEDFIILIEANEKKLQEVLESYGIKEWKINCYLAERRYVITDFIKKSRRKRIYKRARIFRYKV